MKEIIEWFDYPDEKPKESFDYLVSYYADEAPETTLTWVAFWEDGQWLIDDVERIEWDLMQPIIAWAEKPKGVSNDKDV